MNKKFKVSLTNGNSQVVQGYRAYTERGDYIIEQQGGTKSSFHQEDVLCISPVGKSDEV